MVLDALDMGDLVLQTLERAMRTLEVDGSLANAAPPTIQLSREIVDALTFELDQSPGAGQQNSSPLDHKIRRTSSASVIVRRSSFLRG